MKSGGFTLIELLVVTFIIVLLTALILPNYRSGDRALALQRSAYQLAQDLRRAQEMAISAHEFEGAVPAGYGVYLTESAASQYILFADLDGNKNYDAGEEVETLAFEQHVEIDVLSPASPLNIVFTPPDPTVWVNEASDAVGVIILSLESEPAKTQTVSVNSAGLIAVE